MTPDEVIKKYNVTKETCRQLQEQQNRYEAKLRELRLAYWQITGEIQIGDTVEYKGGKGVICEVEIPDYRDPPHCDPYLWMKQYKKDGTQGERKVRIYNIQSCKLISKAA